MSKVVRYTCTIGALRSEVVIERWADSHDLVVENLPALRTRRFEYEAREDEWYGFSDATTRVKVTDRNRHNILDSLLDF